jgi:hypothetical protein
LDKEDLLPGQDWESTIHRVIKDSSHVLFLISRHSVNKRGFVQKELRQALDVLREFPPNQIFIIPCRLDDTTPSHEMLAKLHWVDLFPSYEEGLARIARSLGLEPPKSQGEGEPIVKKRQRPTGPTEMPDEVRDLIRKKAEQDFPDDFSTRRYQIQKEIAAWQKLQAFLPPGLPEEVLTTILERAEGDFPDDYSTRLYQAETEVAAWRKLQQLTAPGIPTEVLRTMVERAESDFPDDFSTRLYQIETEIAAWRDLYDE